MATDNPNISTVLILLPVFYNPDANGVCAPIEDELYIQTAEEISMEFGGGTIQKFNPNPPIGFWWNRGILSKDVLAVLEVDVPDNQESREWLRKYLKEVLLARFRQKAMYLKIVAPIETLEVSTEEVN